MSFVPVTHNFPLVALDEKMRQIFLHELAESGIKNITVGTGVIMETIKDPFFPDKIQKITEEAGMDFVDAHAHFPDPCCPSYPIEEKRSYMLDFLKLELNICSRFGVKTLTVHTGNNFDKTLPLKTYTDAMTRSLEELLPVAEKYGVTIALENIWTQPNTPEVLLEMIKKFPSPYLGLCYDSGHANIMKYAKEEDSPAKIWWQTPEEIPADDMILEKMLPHIVNCHLHDNYGHKDEHNVPGKGNIHWEHVMGLLKKAPRLQCIQNESNYLASGLTFRQIAHIFEKLATEGVC